MKKIIAIALSVLTLLSLALPAFAAPAPDQFEYGKMFDAASFVSDYFDGVTGFTIENVLAQEIYKLHPETGYLVGDESAWVEYVTASEDVIAEAFAALYYDAPVNMAEVFMEEVRNGKRSAEYNSDMLLYRIYNYGKGGLVLAPKILAYRKNGTDYEFWCTKEEVIYAPPEAYPTDGSTPEYLEYGGHIYPYESYGQYYRLGGFLTSGERIVLGTTENGIILKEYEINVELTFDSDEIPEWTGDVNGDGKVNAKDVIAIMKAVVGIRQEKFSTWAADATDDGKVNAKDVIAMMKMLVAK